MGVENLPVRVLYDKDKVDENANIEPALVVPIGTLRTRSANSHAIGLRLYEKIQQDLKELQTGKYMGIPLAEWKKRAPNYPVPQIKELEAKLRILKIENPDDPGENPLDEQVRSVLRLSAGIKGFRSNQATQSLGAHATPTMVGEGQSSLQAVKQQQPLTTVNIAMAATKDAARDSKGPVKRFLGLNGR